MNVTIILKYRMCSLVSKLDLQSFTREFDSLWVPHSSDLVPLLNKKAQ